MGNNNNILKQKPLLIAETYKNILLASTELYISMYVFDLKEGTLTALKTNEHITKLTENCSSLQEMVTNTMVNLSSPETVNTIRKFTDLSTLQERLKDKKVISELFHGKYNYNLSNIPPYHQPDHKLKELIFLFLHIQFYCISSSQKKDI